MADQRLAVEITAKDNASSVFKTIGSNAKSMGTSIEGSTKTAAAGTKTLETGLNNTATASEKAKSAAASFAAGVGLLGAAFAGYSSQIVQNQQSIATLERTYGAAASSVQAFAQQIQQSTAYSSESAIESANIFGTLVRNYGVSVDQVQQLIQVSTDLAATSGLSLEDTSQRVAAAIRGEAESAEALGLTMNQQAIDRNNLTLSMSNQEAGQFRLNALLEQSAFAQGAAADQAETTAGKVKQLANTFNDVGRSVVDATGPIGEAVGALGSFGLSAGLALASIGPMIKGVKDLSAAMKGLQAAEGGSALGGLASALGGTAGGGGLAATLGATATAALSVTAAFTPLIATLIIAKRQADDTMATISGQTDEIEKWAKAISDPDLHQNAVFFAQDIRDMNDSVQDMNTGEVHDITDALDELLSLNTGDLAKLNEILAASGIVLGDLSNQALSVEQLDTIYNAILQVEKEHADYQMQIAEVAQSHAQAISDLTEQYGPLTTAVEESTAGFVRLWMQVNLGKLATKELGSATEAAVDPLGRMVPIIDGLGETSSRTAADVHALAAEIEHVNKLADIQTGNASTVERSYNALRPAVEAVTEAHDQFAESLLGVDDRLADYTQQAFDAAKAVELLSTNAQLFQAAGIKTPALDVAVNLQGGQGGLDAAMGVVNTAKSMSSGIGAAKDWADALIDDVGVVSELDKLLADHRITQEQYKAAQEAQTSISRDVTNAQEDLNAVQAMQAPIVAEMVRQQAEYIDTLQNMTPEQQTAALGYMDTAESAKAMSLAQLAASSTTDTMRASTEQMIQQAAAADPVLKAMLEQMGLLDAEDGTVNFDTNAVDVGAAIQDLTESIDALIVALGGIPPVHTETNAKDTQGFVDDLHKSIDDIPDSVSTTINAIDNATGAIESVREALRTLDGSHAQTSIDNYVNTHQTTYVSTIAGPGTGVTAAFNGATILPHYATGGTVGDIPRYAGGGTHAIVGEYGPEMVLLNRGEQVINTGATKSRMLAERQSSRGGITFNGPVTLQPAGSDAYDAIQQSMRTGVRR